MTIQSMFSFFLKVLGVAVLLVAVWRVYGYLDILKAMVVMQDTSSASALMPLVFELVVLGTFARGLFWLSTTYSIFFTQRKTIITTDTLPDAS